MAYEIGFAPRSARKMSSTTAANAREALKIVRGLEASDEQIKYIKAPYGGEIGIGELELEAERENKADA